MVPRCHIQSWRGAKASTNITVAKQAVLVHTRAAGVPCEGFRVCCGHIGCRPAGYYGTCNFTSSYADVLVGKNLQPIISFCKKSCLKVRARSKTQGAARER